MTKAQEIAAKLDEEWTTNDRWLATLLTQKGAGWFIQSALERRAWLHEARRVAAEEVRKEIGL